MDEIVAVKCNQFAMIVAVAVVSAALPCHSAEPQAKACDSDAKSEPRPLLKSVGIAATIVPGLLVHGTGHWVTGRPCTARRIAHAEALGAAGIGAGGSTIIFTGASRYLMAPAITLTVAGFGLFITSFAADVYGTSGAARIAGEPERQRPRWETELGILHVRDPWFDFEWLVAQRAALNLDRFRVFAAIDTAAGAAFARYQVGAAMRAFGPRPFGVVRDGSFFDLQFGLTEQRHIPAGFLTDTGEMLLTGRLDLERVGPTLRGSFAELSAGVALARTRYQLDGLSVPADLESLLLGRLAFGVYLGRGVQRGSEALLYYDHRHDDYAAGAKLPGLGSGNIGHFGLSGRYFWSKRLGLGASVEVGSAYASGLSLLFRAGGGT